MFLTRVHLFFSIIVRDVVGVERGGDRRRRQALDQDADGETSAF